MSGVPRALVVNDDPEMRDYVALALEGRGWTVHAIAGPDQAEPGGWDLALVDLVAPHGSDPIALVRTLTAAGVPVVIVTGLAPDAPPVRAARAAGAAAVLKKPFSLTALREAAARHRRQA